MVFLHMLMKYCEKTMIYNPNIKFRNSNPSVANNPVIIDQLPTILQTQ